MGFLNTISENILSTIFPVYCLGCGKSGENLCINCISQFPSAERESAKWIFPLFDYRHPPIKRAVWLLKYKGKKSLAKTFGQILYASILEELADLKVMENFNQAILIPIPIENKRKRERGFNQAESICEQLEKLDENANFKLDQNILIKIKNTGHQARIESRSERLKNIIGSFALKEKELNLKGKNIILLDDVTTTGATLSEARKVLKEAGARKVIAFTLAH